MISISKKTTLIYFILLALLILVLRLPSFNLIMDTDSSSIALIARHMLRGEMIYGRLHPDHQLPGIHFTYLLAFKLFGDNPTALKLLLLPFILITAWLIFLIGRMFFDDLSGILSAFFYTLGSAMLYLDGMTVQREHFANLPMTATILLLLILLRKNAPVQQFFWLGVLNAICILYKILFIGPLAVVGLAMLIMAWLQRKQTDNLKTLVLRLGALTLGIITPLVLVAMYFYSVGLWSRFILAFTLGFGYMSEGGLLGTTRFPIPFGFPLFILAMKNIALLLFSLLGTYRLLRRAFPLRTTENLTDFALALWLIISFALAGFRGNGFPHYPLIAIPPLALTAGIEISSAYQRSQTTASKKGAIVGAGMLTLLIVINFFWRNYDLYRLYLPGSLAQKAAFSAKQTQTQALYDYIKSNTTPDDYIYVWSINIQAYYYADRMPPIDIPWSFYASATGPPERIFNPRTKYIIVDDIKIFYRPQWLLDGLKKDYQLETVINGMEIYRRTGS